MAKNMGGTDALEDDVLRAILSEYLLPIELFILSGVSKRWRATALHPSCWAAADLSSAGDAIDDSIAARLLVNDAETAIVGGGDQTAGARVDDVGGGNGGGDGGDGDGDPSPSAACTSGTSRASREHGPALEFGRQALILRSRSLGAARFSGILLRFCSLRRTTLHTLVLDGCSCTGTMGRELFMRVFESCPRLRTLGLAQCSRQLRERWAARETARFVRRSVPADMPVLASNEVRGRIAYNARRPTLLDRPDMVGEPAFLVSPRTRFTSSRAAMSLPRTIETGETRTRILAEIGPYVLSEQTANDAPDGSPTAVGPRPDTRAALINSRTSANANTGDE